jgi:GNAT superfamily N-acetyltransferase
MSIRQTRLIINSIDTILDYSNIYRAMKLNTLSEIEFEFSLKPSDIEDLSDFLLEFQGHAVISDEDAEEKVVASLLGQRLDISRARQSFDDMQSLFDSISPEVSDLGNHIITNNNCYIECCSRNEPEKTPCGSLVYINELLVEPDYRNRKIGTEMLKRMSQVIDLNRSLVALKAFPITDDDTKSCSPAAKKQLKHFYNRLGFRHSGEHYMVKDGRDCHTRGCARWLKKISH